MYCNQQKEWGIQCDKQCKECHKAQSLANKSGGVEDAFKSVIEEGVMEFWGLKTMLKLTRLCAEREENYEVAAKLSEMEKSL